MTRWPNVEIRRIYDEAESDGGHRMLVDRLWPRGVASVLATVVPEEV